MAEYRAARFSALRDVRLFPRPVAVVGSPFRSRPPAELTGVHSLRLIPAQTRPSLRVVGDHSGRDRDGIRHPATTHWSRMLWSWSASTHARREMTASHRGPAAANDHEPWLKCALRVDIPVTVKVGSRSCQGSLDRHIGREPSRPLRAGVKKRRATWLRAPSPTPKVFPGSVFPGSVFPGSDPPRLSPQDPRTPGR